MISMRRGWMTAGCVVVLTLAACGGGEAGTSSGDETSTEALSGEQLDTLETTLRNAATAEETYLRRTSPIRIPWLNSRRQVSTFLQTTLLR